jgi:RimJ/RimL family protein N-acetyltransferase
VTVAGVGVLAVRPARAGDAEAVWLWRNDPVTRAVSRDRAEVSWPVHTAWFADVLADPDRHLLIGVSGAVPAGVGVVRFDRRSPDGRWEVNVNLAPAARGRRLAVPLLRAAFAWLSAKEQVSEVVARIRVDNAASLRTFERAGYVEKSTMSGWSTLVLG